MRRESDRDWLGRGDVAGWLVFDGEVSEPALVGIGAQGYEPTDDDVLHAWETSVGIRETAVATGDMACVYFSVWCVFSVFC